MKNETLYERKGHVIKNLKTGESKAYFTPKGLNSINLAKKASRELQQSNGGLGCGSLRVVS